MAGPISGLRCLEVADDFDGDRSQFEGTLDGLSIEGTIEFEMLDALPALTTMGKPAWTFEGGPITRREKRWLELYMKQIRAMPA
jgi:hypothetical protein